MVQSTSSRTYLDAREAVNCSPGNHLCGSVCVSKKKKCRSPDLNNPTEAAFSKGRKALEAANEKIRNLPRERAIAIDPATGRSIFTADGTETSVAIPEKYRSQLKGAYLTHNHPSMFKEVPDDPRNKGYGFSPDDFALAATQEVAEIHAVSAGFNHTLGPPKEGWNRQWLERKAIPAYNKHYKNVYRESVHKIIFGRLDARIADRDLWHHVMERTAKELGMKYSRTEVKGDSLSDNQGMGLLISDLLNVGLSSAYIEGFSAIRSDKKCGKSAIPDNARCRIGSGSGSLKQPQSDLEKTLDTIIKIEKAKKKARELQEKRQKSERRKKLLAGAALAGGLGFYAYTAHKQRQREKHQAPPSEQ